MLALLGWNPGTEQEIFSMQELIDNFSLERVSKSGARFQPDKAKWFNAQYMHHKSDAELAALYQPILREHGIEVSDELAGRAAGIMKERDQNYPGELNVEAVFDFDDENALEITYLARTDKTTVVNLTNHVYFNLAGEGSGSVLDHQLRLNSSQVLEMNDKQIPTGRLLDAAGTPQDFREFRPFRPGIDSEFNHIRDFKGYDHPFVIDGWKPNILGEVGCLREQTSGRCVTVLSSQPSVMIYTGNWLAGGCPETKSGGRYNDYDGVAIECQNYPDAVNHPEFPSPLLRPGETYCQKIVFRFGTFA